MPFDGVYFSDGKPNHDLIKSVADKNLKRSLIGSYEAVGKSLALEVDEDKTQEEFKNTLRLAYQQGVSHEEIVAFAHTVKDAKSYTWHPTEGLNAKGVELGLALLTAYEQPAEIRAEAVRQAKQNIQDSTDITPTQKDTMINEIDANVTIADRDNKGANMTERFMENAIEEIWGEPTDLSLNLGGRSWIFDADGKNNNEGWATLAALTTLKIAMFDEVIEALEGDFVNYDVDLAALRNDALDVRERLQKINDKSREIVQSLADLPVDERPDYYKFHYDELKTSIEDLRSLYEVVDDKDARGHNFYKRALDLMDKGRKNEGYDDDTALKMDDAFRTLRRNGFIFQKGQPRHNGIVYSKKMIDALFEHEEFLNSDFLRDSDRKLIESKGKFTELTASQQNMIRAHVTRDTKDWDTRQRLQQFLRDAIPLEFDPKNGYPTSAPALLDRLLITAISKRNFAEGIISDAGDLSASEQHFFGKIFGRPGMKHMMLNEDKDTLSMQAKLAILFNENGGAEGAKFRHNKLDLVYKRGPDNEIRIMIPSSDSMRNGGPGTLMQMCNTIREATLAGIQMGVPVEIMLGSGGSMGRFGCDQAMVRRIVAQTLKEYADDRGSDFDPTDEKDAAALRMAAVVMHTEQGRMPRYLSGTPGQIAISHVKRINEMLEDRLELTGRSGKYKFIDSRPPLKPALRDKADELWRGMIDEFHDFRFAVSTIRTNDKGEKTSILNSLAQKTMCPNMRPFMNNGARPGAKGGGKEILDVRAIENDEGKAVGEFFDSSFYAAGAMMAELHRAANSNESPQDRNITTNDPEAIVNQPDWHYFIFAKGVTEAMRFEATKKFEKLGGSDKWDFDKVLEVGKKVSFIKLNSDDKNSPCEMHFDDECGTISDEEAYLAKMYYDRLQFLALTEATLKGEMHRDLDDILNDFRPEDGSLDFAPGEETLKKWEVAQEVYGNHRENDEALQLLHECEAYFEYRLAEGADRDEIIEELGGEARLREIASAWRQGTLAHEPFWTGEYNYGMEKRLKARLEIANDNSPDPDRESQLAHVAA